MSTPIAADAKKETIINGRFSPELSVCHREAVNMLFLSWLVLRRSKWQFHDRQRILASSEGVLNANIRRRQSADRVLSKVAHLGPLMYHVCEVIFRSASVPTLIRG